MRIWGVMDDCIRTGVSTSETTLPGRLRLRRRAPMLYKRLMRGYVSYLYHSFPYIGELISPRFYPGIASSALPSIGSCWRPTEAIDSPPDSDSDNKPLPGSTGAKAGLGPGTGLGGGKVALARAARVVGSFNHAVLPMPPVRSISLPSFLRDLKYNYLV